MKVINLRDIYPHYTQDCFVEVTDEVADLFSEFDHKEAAYRLRTYRHKAYYSLDRNDGIEHEALFVALSPHELYERKSDYAGTSCRHFPVAEQTGETYLRPFHSRHDQKKILPGQKVSMRKSCGLPLSAVCGAWKKF